MTDGTTLESVKVLGYSDMSLELGVDSESLELKESAETEAALLLPSCKLPKVHNFLLDASTIFSNQHKNDPFKNLLHFEDL